MRAKTLRATEPFIAPHVIKRQSSASHRERATDDAIGRTANSNKKTRTKKKKKAWMLPGCGAGLRGTEMMRSSGGSGEVGRERAMAVASADASSATNVRYTFGLSDPPR